MTDESTEWETDYPTVSELPNEPIPDEQVKVFYENNDDVVGTAPLPTAGEDVKGFVAVYEDEIISYIYDPMTNEWLRFNAYSRPSHSLPSVITEAMEDRTEWFAETGRLEAMFGK